MDYIKRAEGDERRRELRAGGPLMAFATEALEAYDRFALHPGR